MQNPPYDLQRFVELGREVFRRLFGSISTYLSIDKAATNYVWGNASLVTTLDDLTNSAFIDRNAEVNELASLNYLPCPPELDSNYFLMGKRQGPKKKPKIRKTRDGRKTRGGRY